MIQTSLISNSDDINEIEQTMDGVQDDIPLILESVESKEYDFIIETVRNIKKNTTLKNIS